LINFFFCHIICRTEEAEKRRGKSAKWIAPGQIMLAGYFFKQNDCCT